MSEGFFKFQDNSFFTKGTPWAPTIDELAALQPRNNCPCCDRDTLPRIFKGLVTLVVEKGKYWPDLLGGYSIGPTTFFSERVVENLADEGVRGIEFQPASIADVRSKSLRSLAVPNYFYFNPQQGIDFDLEASGIANRGTCAVCHQYFPLSDDSPDPKPRRMVPLHNSWTGLDLFCGRNYNSHIMYVTEKVLLLARRHRWTNCRFEPIDILQRDSLRWCGIDYLGKQWPPKYYPDPASAGKSADKWIADFFADDESSFPAQQALIELGPSVVPTLIERLRCSNGEEHSEAARILWLIEAEEVPLPPDVHEEVHRVMAQSRIS